MSTNQTEIPSIPVETTTPVVPTQPEADTQVQATTEVIPEPAVAAATESAETPSGDVVPESNDTDAPAAVEATEASPLPSLNIEEGFVSKRGPLPLRLWQKRYFRLPSGNLTYPLHKLHIVYKKNAKKQALPAEEFEKTNQYLLDTLATATVNANAILSYFKTDSKDELPQGLINLKHVVDITPSPKIKPFAFTIKTKSREYVFSTSSQKDTDSWVATLKSMASAEIPDFSDTAAYKFSYTQLIERKVLTAPQSQDEEVFSASEAEAESDEAPAKVVTEPTAQEGEATQTKTSESNESPQAKSADPKGDAAPEITNQRKSFYSEVKGFFRKGAEGDAKKDETAESASKGVSAEPSDEAVKASDAQPSQEGLALETAGESKASEFSQEIAEMVAPISSDPPALEPETSVVPAEESTENRPTRTKTFNIPKFEGKIFSKIFKKNGQEETQGSKDDSKPADAAVETPKEQTESSTENQAEPSSQEAPSSSEVKTEAPVDAASETPEVKDGEAKEAQEIVAPVESVDKTEPVSQETKKATDTVKSDKRPFIKRLISGSTRSKNAPVEVASETDKAADAEATPAEATSEVAEAKDATVEPVEAKESAVEAEGEAKTEESKPVDANAQRQTSSFITRIGEMAYSAVSSPAPEGEEQISEAFVEKAKSAKRSGFLYKQSTLLHTNNLRFVILSDDGALTYFRNAQTPAEGKKITITSTTELLSTDELLFSIKLATGSTLIFQAKTQEDRDAWLSALESFAKAAVETTTVPEPTTPTGEPVTLDTELPQVASASTITGAEPAADEPVTDAKPSTPEVPTVTDAEVTAPAIEELKATPANN